MGFVKMGNKGSSPILGIGNICVSANLGLKPTLKNVRLVSDLHLNLLSVGKFDEERYTSYSAEGCWKLSKGVFVQAEGKKCCILCRT